MIMRSWQRQLPVLLCQPGLSQELHCSGVRGWECCRAGKHNGELCYVGREKGGVQQHHDEVNGAWLGVDFRVGYDEVDMFRQPSQPAAGVSRYCESLTGLMYCQDINMRIDVKREETGLTLVSVQHETHCLGILFSVAFNMHCTLGHVIGLHK